MKAEALGICDYGEVAGIHKAVGDGSLGTGDNVEEAAGVEADVQYWGKYLRRGSKGGNG